MLIKALINAPDTVQLRCYSGVQAFDGDLLVKALFK